MAVQLRTRQVDASVAATGVEAFEADKLTGRVDIKSSELRLLCLLDGIFLRL
jgi:hypothetical protein